jgi:crotonobetainyl-CoA:carnitine CoA-transferase CaiB-like acyl-CoA transferase
MSPIEIAATVRAKLAAQLDEDLAALTRLSDVIHRLSQRTDDPDREWLRVRALSFELERWYTAVESTIERALRQLDGAVPEGRSWHEELLRAAAVAVEGLRPALISRDAAEALREVMRFRHFSRHGYDREPDVERVDELARVALAAHHVCAPSLRALCEWLRPVG